MTEIYSTIQYTDIDSFDTSMDWADSNPSEMLRQAISHSGILMPLTVQSQSGKQTFRIIDGFRRYKALKQVCGEENPQIPVKILPESLSFKTLAMMRLHGFSGERAFSGIRLCRVIRQLSENGFSGDEFTSQVLPLLGLSPSRKTVQILKQLVEFLPEMEAYPFLQELGHEDLAVLLRFSATEIPVILQAFHSMNPGGNKWKALLGLLHDICRIQQKTVSELLRVPPLPEILEAAHLQGPVRYRMLKEQLEQWRFPTLQRLRHDLNELRHQLKIPTNTQLETDPFLEQESITLRLQVSSAPELQDSLHSLNSEQNEPLWTKMFELLKGRQ
ncbi:MAG: ParB N-terminal domain-containing protein [SAR324 cluster bacterium]|nr:ParB N-terminal domain-containing protein [SAR324 cluster bacterium]